MNNFQNLRVIILLFAGLLGTSVLFSQEISDPEAEYNRIRENAISGNYEIAVSDARKLLKSYPGYGDARILLARITAWQKKYNEASAIVDSLISEDPSNNDALSLKSDISKWSKEEKKPSNFLKAGYSFDSFTEPYTRFWQVFSAGAGHRFNWGKAAAAINTGHIVTGDPSVIANEYQLEAEAYPVISKKNYAFVSYAFSPGKYFPAHRASVEIWQVLPASWSISAGLSYYYFDRNIFIAGLSGEKYLGDFWFSAKAFIYFKDEGPTYSGYLNARYYMNDADYLQLTYNLGTAPDEPFDIQADLMRLSANGIRIAYNHEFRNGLSIRIGAGYSVEEYYESSWRNRFEGNAGITFPIKRR
jgi:YaiO family outer membrane protein